MAITYTVNNLNTPGIKVRGKNIKNYCEFNWSWNYHHNTDKRIFLTKCTKREPHGSDQTARSGQDPRRSTPIYPGEIQQIAQRAVIET